MYREEDINECLDTNTRESIVFTVRKLSYDYGWWRVCFEFPLDRDPISVDSLSFEDAVDEVIRQFKELTFVD